MTIADINRVCFVGAGTMGCYNAIVAAVSGYDAVLFDVDEQTLHQVPQRHAELAAQLVAYGYCSAQAIQPALARVTLTGNLDVAVSAADLVSESVFERLDIKRDTHRLLDEACPAHTILTTNSSTLLVSDIESVVRRGNRFAALHSHLGSPLVDIVAGPRTSGATVDILERYALSIGGVPLRLKKEYPGYVLNAMLGQVLSCAMQLLGAGIASVEDIDRSWMIARKAAAGPFGLMDLFGTNVIHDSWRYRRQDHELAGLRRRILALLGPMVERGELGMKAGRGFYAYPSPAYQREGFLTTAPAMTSVDRSLTTALVGNALVIAAHDVLEPDDIDRAWMTGMFQSTGPFAVLEEIGADAFMAMLAEQVNAGFFSASRAHAAAGYLAQHWRRR